PVGRWRVGGLVTLGVEVAVPRGCLAVGLALGRLAVGLTLGWPLLPRRRWRVGVKRLLGALIVNHAGTPTRCRLRPRGQAGQGRPAPAEYRAADTGSGSARRGGPSSSPRTPARRRPAGRWARRASPAGRRWRRRTVAAGRRGRS